MNPNMKRPKPAFETAEENAAALAKVFGFAEFSRFQARLEGLENALNGAHDRVRFIRCVGSTPDRSIYNGDFEIFRVRT